MVLARISFEPLAQQKVTHNFKAVTLDLPVENKLYVIGLKAAHKHGAGPDWSAGFADNTDSSGFCIVPSESEEAKEIDDPFAVIWLASGYRVMIIPTEGSKIYYQRATENNLLWTKIKKGWAFDLSDPLLTKLDGAIHVKFDTLPDDRRQGWYKRKIHKYFARLMESSAVVEKIEKGKLQGQEEHNEVRHHQVSARVCVKWGRDNEDIQNKRENKKLKESFNAGSDTGSTTNSRSDAGSVASFATSTSTEDGGRGSPAHGHYDDGQIYHHGPLTPYLSGPMAPMMLQRSRSHDYESFPTATLSADIDIVTDSATSDKQKTFYDSRPRSTSPSECSVHLGAERAGTGTTGIAEG